MMITPNIQVNLDLDVPLYNETAHNPGSVIIDLPKTDSGSCAVLIPPALSHTSVYTFEPYSQKRAQLYENAEWAKTFFAEGIELKTPKRLFPYYKEINKLISGKEFDLCNCLIDEINPIYMSNTVLSGVLRLTYSYREQLPAWAGLLQSTREILAKRGKDSAALLKGLDS